LTPKLGTHIERLTDCLDPCRIPSFFGSLNYTPTHPAGREEEEGERRRRTKNKDCAAVSATAAMVFLPTRAPRPAT